MLDFCLPARRGRLLHLFGVLSAALGLGMVAVVYNRPGFYQGAGTLWVSDPLGLFFKVLVLAAAVLALFLAADYRTGHRGHRGSFAALVLLAAVGMMLLVGAVDFLLIFLALELVSISSFILVGYEYRTRESSEGAVKYFLIGALSSAMLAYGISLFYGAVGTTALSGLRPLFAGPASLMFVMAVLLITVGFGFKVSMVPFHLWVPDAYEGAPTPITAFLSVAPKVAGLAAMLRVFTHMVPHTALDLTTVFAVLAVLTMTVGNLTALFQTNVKRLLAYSSIAQAGYMLIGFVTADLMGREGLLLYSLVYLFMNMGAFAVAIVVANERDYGLGSFDGLARRDLGLALMMSFFLLSLAGIPPLAGFVAKFYLFAAAVKGGFIWLAIAGVLNSVISVYYYMRVCYHMFFREPRGAEAPPTGPFLYSTLTLAAVAVILLGVYPEPLLGAVKASARFFPATISAANATFFHP